ncbi:MAG: polyphosphate kinase 1 [Ferruginibacter sp.]
MFFNRDLSWLTFNHLVLQHARKKEVPLYERLRFLAIFSSNLDEFFRVRYPAIIAFSKLDKKTIKKESLISQDDISEKIQAKINVQLDEFGDALLNHIIPELKENKIFFYYNARILVQHIQEIREIFLSQVLSFIQPIILGAETTYDFTPENNQIYLVVTLKDNIKDTIRHTIINIPSKKLKRFYVLTPLEEIQYVIFIDDIIRENIGMLFPGLHIESVYSIKFNRDAELKLDDEYSTDLLDKLEKRLSKRDHGATSRFLYEKGMPSNLQFFLASLFQVNLDDMFEGGKYHNLSDLFTFPSFNKSLSYSPFKSLSFPASTASGDIFYSIMQKDILLHLPYHSYTPVLSFFNQAAVDTDVTQIFITLYRVASESHIVNALISAAKNGKKVTAFIELKARFDEANNIKWSRMMKKAGITLIYSEPRIKVHSKIALVQKKIENNIVSFAVLSTGNFNESTALFYTDHVLLTVDRDISKELMQLFEFLQKKNVAIEKNKLKFTNLMVSQFNLLNEFEQLIDKEIKKAKNGLPALIRIKVNNLEEPWFINLLYKASTAGVKINLIVRSVCCLVPGMAGISSNITVKRIVDRFLEHTRLFIFGTQEDDILVAMGSSDLMTRNLRNRIEVCVKIKDASCRNELIDYFELQWSDNTNAVEILSNLDYVPVEQNNNERVNAQQAIFSYLQNKQWQI